MDTLQHIAELLKDALLRKLGAEIDLIFQYGSLLKGTAHKYSDLDISYTPVNEGAWDSITVIVGETLVDLYPIHWSVLERMADFDDLSSTVLLNYRILYQRNETAAGRLQALSTRLQGLLQPEARPAMIRKAQKFFQRTGYEHYLLRQQAAAGHPLACMQHAQSILRTVLHCLAVCNQACIDTRKIEQVLALPKLPPGFLDTIQRLIVACQPSELLSACETLLQTTRDFLLAEQRQVLQPETTLPAVFDAAYPELKRDLQGVLLGCERQNIFEIKGSLISIYHELSQGMAQVFTGVEYTDFNSLAEYEQDLATLGFPALLPYLLAGDFARLHAQCLAFDHRLQEFFAEQSVELNKFSTLDDLQRYLGANYCEPKITP